MNILLCNTFFYPAVGGIENYLLNIARVYLREGNLVTVLTMAYDESLKKEVFFEGIKIIRFPLKTNRFGLRFLEPLDWLNSFRAAAKRMSPGEKYDLYIARDLFSLNALHNSVSDKSRIIYVQATAYPLYLRYSFRNKGNSFRSRLYWKLYVSIWSAALGRIERSRILKTRKLSTLSRSKRFEISSYYHISEALYNVIPPGVDTSVYHPCNTQYEKEMLRKELGLPDNRTIFLYAGRFEGEKNPEGILEAAKKVIGDQLHFVFIGNYNMPFIKKAHSCGLQDHITLTGIKNEPAEYFRCCDIFVLPSLTEGFGHVILEAMASALPVIAFRNPENQHILATDELIINNVTGILVDYEDYHAMAKAFKLLSDNQALQKTIGINAFNHLKDKYRWENTAKKLLELQP